MQIKQAWIGSYLRREGCVCSHDRPKILNPISCVQRMVQATRLPSQIMYYHDRQIGFAFNFMCAICGSGNTYAQITHSFLYCKSSTHNQKHFFGCPAPPPPSFLVSSHWLCLNGSQTAREWMCLERSTDLSRKARRRGRHA